MKYSLVFTTLASMAIATPFDVIKPRVTGTTANDLLDDTSCRANYLIIARASTEADNIVSLWTMPHPFPKINV